MYHISGHILWGDSLKSSPYGGLIYGRYFQFRCLTWPLIIKVCINGMMLPRKDLGLLKHINHVEHPFLADHPSKICTSKVDVPIASMLLGYPVSRQIKYDKLALAVDMWHPGGQPEKTFHFWQAGTCDRGPCAESHTEPLSWVHQFTPTHPRQRRQVVRRSSERLPPKRLEQSHQLFLCLRNGTGTCVERASE